MYQNGDVDYLVATDAIGMGLNLDIDHVAFSSTAKFDGRRMRPLAPNELAQIAGRAGRHMNDGTFGVTGEARALADEVVEAITAHASRRSAGCSGATRGSGLRLARAADRLARGADRGRRG